MITRYGFRPYCSGASEDSTRKTPLLALQVMTLRVGFSQSREPRGGLDELDGLVEHDPGLVAGGGRGVDLGRGCSADSSPYRPSTEAIVDLPFLRAMPEQRLVVDALAVVVDQEQLVEEVLLPRLDVHRLAGPAALGLDDPLAGELADEGPWPPRMVRGGSSTATTSRLPEVDGRP